MIEYSLTTFVVSFPFFLIKSKGEAIGRSAVTVGFRGHGNIHTPQNAAKPTSICRSSCFSDLKFPLSLSRQASASQFPSNFRLSRCAYHHSSRLQRYFTNRYHKKVCPKCKRTNILPSTSCSFCLTPLNDLHIQSIGKDPLWELALSRGVNHDQSVLLKAKYEYLKENKSKKNKEGLLKEILKDLPQPLIGSLCVGAAAAATASPSAATAAVTAAAAAAGGGSPGVSGLGYTELYRSFNFVITTTPFPSSFIHLLAIPRACFYDIKQLRKTHIPLLQAMKEKTHAIMELLLPLQLQLLQLQQQQQQQQVDAGSSIPEGAPLLSNREQQKEVKGKTDREAAAIECKMSSSSNSSSSSNNNNNKSLKGKEKELLQMAIYGFNYPAEYRQVCMHAIIPPLFNLSLFNFPFFYSFYKTIKDIQTCGSVQVFSPSSILT
ncbi:Pv1h14035_P, related, related [Eimeria maxima]|uniref:Pv1h14035_P, related, related n=1 Tax=Eimeria maxima TaxID=5804 RepID=U6M4X4_EIMMA|nr:Pv1h14035_P, related, related [Eimeria maxima]CDJ57504.1 Pv1h14035_P, related, related [Eimeria maxima]